MKFRIMEQMIAVVRAEEQRRASLLTDEDPHIAQVQWMFSDAPFVNEMCLMLLVALWHQVERELVDFAARAAGKDEEVSVQHYEVRVGQLRKGKNWDWTTISARLNLKSCDWYLSMEILRLLANSYKHHPAMEPDDELLAALSLELGANYSPLPESDAVRKGLASCVHLCKDADYCDIAERLVQIAQTFLETVQSRTRLSRIRWEAASLDPSTFAR